MAKKQSKTNKNGNQLGIGILLGAAVGYVVSYLTASKAGEVLQDELAEKARVWKEIAVQTTEDLKEVVKEGVEDSKDTFQESPKSTHPEWPVVPDETIESEVLLAEANENKIDSTVEKGFPLP